MAALCSPSVYSVKCLVDYTATDVAFLGWQRPRMSNFLRAWRVAKGMTLEAVAQATNSHKTQISKMELAQRGVSMDWLSRLAKVYGVDAAALMSAPPETNGATEPEPPLPPGEDLVPAPMLSRHDMPLDVPVYGTAVGGAVGDFQINGQTVDYIRRPPALRAAKNAFAIFYANDSMFPAFEAGDPLYVNPAIPPRAGDYIIIEMAPGRTGEPGAAYVKRLVRKTEKTLIVAQYNPPRDDMKFEMAKIKAVWRVVPTRELLGV